MKVLEQLSHGCRNTINEKNTIYCKTILFSANQMRNKSRIFSIVVDYPCKMESTSSE